MPTGSKMRRSHIIVGTTLPVAWLVVVEATI
jgi:hypothetical protein